MDTAAVSAFLADLVKSNSNTGTDSCTDSEHGDDQDQPDSLRRPKHGMLY